MADALLIERSECALIWHAEAKNNEIIDFRADTSPQSVLGVQLIHRPHVNRQGTSPEHAFNIIGGR